MEKELKELKAYMGMVGLGLWGLGVVLILTAVQNDPIKTTIENFKSVIFYVGLFLVFIGFIMGIKSLNKPENTNTENKKETPKNWRDECSNDCNCGQ